MGTTKSRSDTASKYKAELVYDIRLMRYEIHLQGPDGASFLLGLPSDSEQAVLDAFYRHGLLPSEDLLPEESAPALPPANDPLADTAGHLVGIVHELRTELSALRAQHIAFAERVAGWLVDIIQQKGKK